MYVQHIQAGALWEPRFLHLSNGLNNPFTPEDCGDGIGGIVKGQTTLLSSYGSGAAVSAGAAKVRSRVPNTGLHHLAARTHAGLEERERRRPPLCGSAPGAA